MAELITVNPDNTLNIPDNPVIGCIPGDGTGPDIWNAARPVLDRAVETAYAGQRKIHFEELPAGEAGFQKTGEWLPRSTLEQIRQFRVAIKGPMTTPVGKGMRSLNVAIRQELDLFACIRPARYIQGVPSPCSNPSAIDMVIFRENTEDLYAGIEWQSGSGDAKEIIDFIRNKTGKALAPDTTGIGIKPISEANTKRLVRKAIHYALENNRTSVTLMHKGNIMKFTEGAFLNWGMAVGKEDFAGTVILEDQLYKEFNGTLPPGKILLKDRIADNMFQQVLLRPEDYDVIATPNLNGDYISDLLAAMVGGLGLAPGANIGTDCAVFEATHGTAPKYAGKDRVNPGSLILSGAMMLAHMGWHEAADKIHDALQKAVTAKTVTYDLARQIPGAAEVSCSGFGQRICKLMGG